MSDEPPTTLGSAQAESVSGADPTSLVGRLLADRYRIVAKLGEGAMGAVYLGEHLRMGRRDAIKVMRPNYAQDLEAIARFTRGTRNVSAIRHPNVCTIYDFSDTPEGIRYLAMEYIEGETLKQTLDREGRLAPDRAVDIACQVAEALQAGHDVGVIHRDLKPGNIMLCRRARPDSREVVKVVDFDISKSAGDAEGDEVTRTGFVVGTPEYMSPEQLIGERLDGRSDLYSLGVVLFRMLTGRLPFRAENTQDMMLERLTGSPMRLDEAVPGTSIAAIPQLQRALDRALARKPADRQASTEEFGREIVAALRDQPVGRATAVAPAAPMAPATAAALQPVSIRDETPLTPTREAVAVDVPARTTKRRKPLLLAAGGLTIVALGAGVLWWQTHGTEAQHIVVAGDTTQQRLDSSRLGNADTASAGESTGRRQAPDTAVATSKPREAGPAGRRAASDTKPPQGPGASRLSPATLAAMLDRQLDALSSGKPTAAVVRAARDSAELALGATAVRRDSATALLVLAQAALASGDPVGCAKWARRGADLGIGSAGFDALLQACR